MIMFFWYDLNIKYGTSNRGKKVTVFKEKYDVLLEEKAPFDEVSSKRNEEDNYAEEFFVEYFGLVKKGKEL